MPGETAELSLKDQLVEARKRSEAGAEKGLNSVEGVRSKTREFIKEKINQFRKWDRESSIKLLGAVGALPEQGKVVVQAGINEIGKGINAGKEAVVGAAESSKKFLIDRKDAVVQKGREIGYWFEDRGNDIENFAEETKDKIDNGVDRGVDKVLNKYEDTKLEIVNSYDKAGNFVSDKVTEFKLRLVKAHLERVKNRKEEASMKKNESREKRRAKFERENEKLNKANSEVVSVSTKLAEVNAQLYKK